MTAILRLMTAGALAASSAIALDTWFAGLDKISAISSLPVQPPELAALDVDILLAEPVLAAITSKPPFYPSRRPPQSDEMSQVVAEADPSPSFKSEETVILHGVFIAGSRRSALISVGDDNRFWLSEGAQKSGVELLSIRPKSALVRQGGRQILMHIDSPVLLDTDPTKELRS